MYSGSEFIFHIHSSFIDLNHNDAIEVIVMEKSEILAYSVLFVGVGLLVFTFFNAYLFLGEKIRFLSTNLIEAFGESIGPLIETCIRIMYLGIMGWIGSILTVRGIQLLTQFKHEAKASEIPKVPEQKERKKEG